MRGHSALSFDIPPPPFFDGTCLPELVPTLMGGFWSLCMRSWLRRYLFLSLLFISEPFLLGLLLGHYFHDPFHIRLLLSSLILAVLKRSNTNGCSAKYSPVCGFHYGRCTQCQSNQFIYLLSCLKRACAQGDVGLPPNMNLNPPTPAPPKINASPPSLPHGVWCTRKKSSGFMVLTASPTVARRLWSKPSGKGRDLRESSA